MSASRQIAYDVVNVSAPLFDLVNPTLALSVAGRPTMIVADETVHALYGSPAIAYLTHHGIECSEVVIHSGEARKSWEQVDYVCRTASDRGLPRKGILMALGGGVTLDIVGLAASLYRRGVGYVRIPTSLLAIVDASVGIKQGVNYAGKKSMLGAFYPPDTTLCDLNFLKTLPLDEVSSGFAEIIKMALIRSSSLMDELVEHAGALTASRFQQPADVAHEVVVAAQQLMMEELQPNLFEKDLARLVDFGHTFSPHIEAAQQFGASHGHAVAIDILLSLAIGVEQGICSGSLLARVERLFCDVGLTGALPAMEPEQLRVRSVDSARRHRGSCLNLVVPSAAGAAVFVQDVGQADFRRAWERVRRGTGIPRP